MEGFTITMQVTSPGGETRTCLFYDPAFHLAVYRAKLLADGWQCAEPVAWWGELPSVESVLRRLQEGG